MENNFEIFVQISGQKFEICLQKKNHLIHFNDIYHKLKRVVKIGANEDIEFLTHDFELFEHGAPNKTIIRLFGTTIKNSSLICIKPKSKQLVSHTIGSDDVINSSTSRAKKDQNPVISSTLKAAKPQEVVRHMQESNVVPNPCSQISTERLQELSKSRAQIEDFYAIVLAINIGWDFRCGKVNKWKRVSTTVNRFRKYNKVDPGYCNTIFHKWAQYYVQNYDEFDGKMDRLSQRYFNLLKVIHTLDMKRLYPKSSQIRPKIKKISKKKSFKQYFDRFLKAIRLKKIKENRKNQNKSKEQPTVDNTCEATNISRVTEESLN